MIFQIIVLRLSKKIQNHLKYLSIYVKKFRVYPKVTECGGCLDQLITLHQCESYIAPLQEIDIC